MDCDSRGDAQRRGRSTDSAFLSGADRRRARGTASACRPACRRANAPARSARSCGAGRAAGGGGDRPSRRRRRRLAGRHGAGGRTGGRGGLAGGRAAAVVRCRCWARAMRCGARSAPGHGARLLPRRRHRGLLGALRHRPAGSARVRAGRVVRQGLLPAAAGSRHRRGGGDERRRPRRRRGADRGRARGGRRRRSRQPADGAAGAGAAVPAAGRDPPAAGGRGGGAQGAARTPAVRDGLWRGDRRC